MDSVGTEFSAVLSKLKLLSCKMICQLVNYIT